MIRIFGLVFTHAVLLSNSAFARDPLSAPHVRVCVHNAARVPAAVVHDGLIECARIFRATGIAIDWIEAGDRRPEDLRVIIAPLAPPMATPSALGFVARMPTGYSAFVVWSRVVPWIGYHRPAFDILGRVMAHEIGHVLLPEDSHSEVGIMRAVWTPDDLRSTSPGAFFFTADEQVHMQREIIRRDRSAKSHAPW